MKAGSLAEECDLFLNQWLVLALRSSKVNASRGKSAPHNPCRSRSTDITDEGARLIAIIPSGLISCPSGCLTIVVIQQSAQPLAALNRTAVTGARLLLHDQPVAQPLVVALVMIQVISTTPILESVAKSAIRGIRGTAGQCGCIPRS